jgi:hypothetical protein
MTIATQHHLLLSFGHATNHVLKWPLQYNTTYYSHLDMPPIMSLNDHTSQHHLLLSFGHATYHVLKWPLQHNTTYCSHQELSKSTSLQRCPYLTPIKQGFGKKIKGNSLIRQLMIAIEYRKIPINNSHANFPPWCIGWEIGKKAIKWYHRHTSTIVQWTCAKIWLFLVVSYEGYNGLKQFMKCQEIRENV